ncbi:MAG: hypothetical protein K9M98_04770 [Cephaloticoccus sp.]|nr:hypothetical protein [Cephaloticoccus sp.]MCF7759794.1 hypothetical protein [Cephaloticoccus sp.]
MKVVSVSPKIEMPMEAAEKVKARRTIMFIYILMVVLIAGPILIYLLTR